MSENRTARLSPGEVDRIVRACLFDDDGPRDNPVMAEGINHRFGFHPDRLRAHTSEIHDLLLQLPDEFTRPGGHSFLAAGVDRKGRIWTGNTATIEALMCLGLASGLVQMLIPRDLWKHLPGGLPCFLVRGRDA